MLTSVSRRQYFTFLFIIVVVILNISSFKCINDVFAKDSEQSIAPPDMSTTQTDTAPLWISKEDPSTTDEAPSSSSLIPAMNSEEIDVDKSAPSTAADISQQVAKAYSGTDANVNICLSEQKVDGTTVESYSKNQDNPNTNECNNNSMSSSYEGSIISQGKNTPILATEQGGVIIGTSGPDAIYGEDNDDIIQSRDGNDELYGGKGEDHLQGGTSSDTLSGENGNDVLNGGFEDDYLNGGNKNDFIYGSFGDDILEGGPGQDYFNCGDGIDIVLDFSIRDGDIITSSCEDVQRDDT